MKSNEYKKNGEASYDATPYFFLIFKIQVSKNLDFLLILFYDQGAVILVDSGSLFFSHLDESY